MTWMPTTRLGRARRQTTFIVVAGLRLESA